MTTAYFRSVFFEPHTFTFRFVMEYTVDDVVRRMYTCADCASGNAESHAKALSNA